MRRVYVGEFTWIVAHKEEAADGVITYSLLGARKYQQVKLDPRHVLSSYSLNKIYGMRYQIDIKLLEIPGRVSKEGEWPSIIDLVEETDKRYRDFMRSYDFYKNQEELNPKSRWEKRRLNRRINRNKPPFVLG